MEDKILAVGGEKGTVAVVGLMARSIVARIKLSGKNSAVNAVSFFSESVLLVGCENGKIMCLALPELKVFWALHDSDSPIRSLLSLPKSNGFIVGKLDGACVFYSLKVDKQLTNVRVILSGADADPVNTIKSDGCHIYTGARDGQIRKYNINDL